MRNTYRNWKSSMTKNVRYNRLLTPERFWKRIQKPVGCWLYDGAKETNGYGYLLSPLQEGSQYITSHKLAWILTHGPVPDGKQVLHKCDIRACCNPEHLYLGDDAANAADKMSRKRQSRGEDNFKATITEVQAREIWALKGTMSALEVAQRYARGPGLVHGIWSRKTWKIIHERY